MKKDIASIIHKLKAMHGEPRCELKYSNAVELTVATVLSAQCTDERVNKVTPVLFARYPTPEALAGAELAELEEIIHSTGFFHNKAKSLIGMSRALLERFHGDSLSIDILPASNS